MCYKASALSRNQIRRHVQYIREQAGLENEIYFPILFYVENILPLLFPDFKFEIVQKEEMGSKHGETYPDKNIIRIREDVYEGAADGKGRDRLTVGHEVGHFFEHEEDSIVLCRLAPGQKLKPYEDPEWQADAFAGELLAPSNLIKNMSVEEVMLKCGVSEAAARNQLNHSRK